MKVAVIVQPRTLSEPGEARDLVERSCAAAGHEVIAWLQTTPEEDGCGLARQAVTAGADLLLCAGGDGTVRAVANALANTEVALGVLPTGTGNLLARNLGLPLQFEPALKVALDGVRRRLDLGLLTVPGSAESTRFLVMAGIGFDAAMMADASPALKARLGWPAYVLSAIHHLRDEAMRCTISLDDRPARRRRARAVLIGNVGELQGGLALLPCARPDDGYLDVAVLAPRTALDWLRILARGITRSTSSDRRLEHARARRIEVCTARPQPLEYDGDASGHVRRFIVQAEPSALTLMVPA